MSELKKKRTDLERRANALRKSAWSDIQTARWADSELEHLEQYITEQEIRQKEESENRHVDIDYLKKHEAEWEFEAAREQYLNDLCAPLDY